MIVLIELRGQESNLRLSGNEPGDLPLIYPAVSHTFGYVSLSVVIPISGIHELTACSMAEDQVFAFVDPILSGATPIRDYIRNLY